MAEKTISLPDPSPTAYDDAFRTMLNDCSALIIPVVNLYFNENYTGNEEITFSKNEHYLAQRKSGSQTPALSSLVPTEPVSDTT